MLRSLPLCLILLLAACGDATPTAPDSPAVPATVATSDAEAPADGALTETVDLADVPADAPADDVLATPTSAPASASAAPSRASASRTPMVEVNTSASVYHATSDARQLTLRGGPSTSSDNLGTFGTYGDAFVLECQDLKRDDAWCRVRAEMSTGERVGWAKRRHLIYVGNAWTEENGVRMFGSEDFSGTSNGRGPAEGFPVSARWDILADDGHANVRATPNGAVVRRLDNRTMTDVVRCDGGAPGERWCEISSPVAGWVHQSGFHRQLRAY